MEHEARVEGEIRDGRRRRRLQIGEIEGEREDGGWSGSSEGDRVQNVWGKQKKKKNEGIALQNMKDTSPMAACIKRGLRPAQKKRRKKSRKRSLRPGLRPHV